MRHELIKPLSEDYYEYLKDESRKTGHAQSISFPQNEGQVIEVLDYLYKEGVNITIQGARTGLAAGAVPSGGHIMNLSKMDKITRMRKDDKGNFYIAAQPGASLLKISNRIKDRKFDTSDWDDISKHVLSEFKKAGQYFFSPDPTEPAATIGGMVACNASGARSYLYGPVRKHTAALRAVLYNCDTLQINRGACFAKGRELKLCTEQGNKINVKLPKYTMPDTKNASGYYIKDNMDAIDLFIGSDGTLGVITEVEIKLLKLPDSIIGVGCFFEDSTHALDFVTAVREKVKSAAAIEYFDKNAMNVLEKQREHVTSFSKLPEIPKGMASMVYTELHCETQDEGFTELEKLDSVIASADRDNTVTWVADNEKDLSMLYLFRHAVPESVNLLIDQRKRKDMSITKLGTDMSVPDMHLKTVMNMYETMLKSYNLEYAIWGHIGDNHLHVNILPRDSEDYKKGQELYDIWAKKITALGGAVSAEHGVGKLKTKYLEIMYGKSNIEQMKELRRILDPKGLLNRGNMFEL